MEYHIARINYHYRKLQMTRQRLEATDAGGNIEFEAYVFFEVCFHLKDWIKHDVRYIAGHHDVELYISESPELQILHDLCNRLKHRTLSRPKTDIGDFIVRLTTEVGPDGAYLRLDKLAAKVDGEIVCMFAFSAEAIRAWAKYFDRHPELRPASGCGLIAV